MIKAAFGQAVRLARCAARSAITSALLLLLTLCAAAPPLAYAAPLQVVSTSSDLRALALAIGGDQVQVQSLLPPRHDPHSAELKPGQLASLRRADLVLRVGLDHEPWFARAGVPAQVSVLDLSRHVSLLQTETPRLRVNKRAHVHAFGNTHYWLDPENARGMTLALVREFSRLRPQAAAQFERNRLAFVQKLDQALLRWQAELQPFKGMRVVVMHDSWTYFAHRFGLQIAAAAEPNPGVPPSPSELAALASEMRAARVALLIADPSSAPELVAQLSRLTGVPSVTLLPSVGAGPGADDYVSLFDTNVTLLRQALKK